MQCRACQLHSESLLPNWCLRHSFEIHGFRPTWTCQIVKFLTGRTKFLQLSGHCNIINCAFTFRTPNVFGCLLGVMARSEFVKYKLLRCLFSYASLKNTQSECVSAQITTILLTTVIIYHSLNCFSHLIYTLQTSKQQKIAKLLNSPIHIINYSYRKVISFYIQ